MKGGREDGPRMYRVTITMLRTYAASLEVRASSQAEADAALAAFETNACERGLDGCSLGLPAPWVEHEGRDHDPEIDTEDRCVDCGEEKIGEYYMVRNEVWAASGVAPNGGQLCLTDLERRIGRELTGEDFTTLWPTLEAWERHLAARTAQQDCEAGAGAEA
jgi:hypothetical protein